MSECKHCWHHTGASYTTDPPVHDEVCCQCGETRRVLRVEPSAGHGPYLPRRTWTPAVQPWEPVPDTSSARPWWQSLPGWPVPSPSVAPLTVGPGPGSGVVPLTVGTGVAPLIVGPQPATGLDKYEQPWWGSYDFGAED